MKFFQRKRAPLKTTARQQINFLAEQLGESEDKLKRDLVGIFCELKIPLRAYLSQLSYGDEDEIVVALCLRTKSADNDNLAQKVTEVFRGQFSQSEHLDIIFVDEEQEKRLRKKTCPFYNFASFQVAIPDFYLTSSEGYNLDALRACFKVRRFLGSHPDGYLLCDIDPPIPGQDYGMGGEDLEQVILATRHEGSSLFVADIWPVYVHVARLVEKLKPYQGILKEADVELIGWGEIYSDVRSASEGRDGIE